MVITAQDVYEAFARDQVFATPFFGLNTEQYRRFEAIAIELSVKAAAICIDEQHAALAERSIQRRSGARAA